MLYEALAGRRRAFDGDTPEAVLAGMLGRTPVPIRHVRADVPAGVDAVLRGALARATRHRPAAAGALRDDLDRVLRGEHPRVRGPRRSWWGRTAIVGGSGRRPPVESPLQVSRRLPVERFELANVGPDVADHQGAQILT